MAAVAGVAGAAALDAGVFVCVWRQTITDKATTAIDSPANASHTGLRHASAPRAA
jgi:hypothetical protein